MLGPDVDAVMDVVGPCASLAVKTRVAKLYHNRVGDGCFAFMEYNRSGTVTYVVMKHVSTKHDTALPFTTCRCLPAVACQNSCAPLARARSQIGRKVRTIITTYSQLKTVRAHGMSSRKKDQSPGVGGHLEACINIEFERARNGKRDVFS